MGKLSLDEENYLKVISFMDAIQVEDDDFRKEILLAFEELFGIHKMNFWLYDEQHNPLEPVTNNISKDITKDYLNHYVEEDPLLPNKLKDILPKRRVIDLFDLPRKAYEHTEYFNTFMKKHGIRNNTAIFLVKDKKVLGCVDFSSRDEKRIQKTEIIGFEILARYLAQRFHEHLELKKSEDTFGGISLTPREKEVLQFVQKGLSNKEIADSLFISVNTVKKHVQRLYDKFGVNNRTSLSVKAFRLESGMENIR